MSLSEPNVFLLDYAEYSINDCKWEPAEEILRIDNFVREKFNIPLKLEAYKQPWKIEQEKRAPVAKLTLRFTFQSEIDINKPVMLALEDAATIGIILNGHKVHYENAQEAWWVDEDIKTVKLPDNVIKCGSNELSLTYDFGILTNVERVYLLGDFGVTLHGQKTTLTNSTVADLTFGDWTTQGLPFYAGNVLYHCTMSIPDNDTAGTEASNAAIQIPSFIAPLLTVAVDGKPAGRIAFQPNILELGHLTPGSHNITITSFGNRFNSFGTIHLPTGTTTWCNPNAWRLQGLRWQDEYRIEPMGILQAPQVLVPGKNNFQKLHLGGD